MKLLWNVLVIWCDSGEFALWILEINWTSFFFCPSLLNCCRQIHWISSFPKHRFFSCQTKWLRDSGTVRFALCFCSEPSFDDFFDVFVWFSLITFSACDSALISCLPSSVAASSWFSLGIGMSFSSWSASTCLSGFSSCWWLRLISLFSSC